MNQLPNMRPLPRPPREFLGIATEEWREIGLLAVVLVIACALVWTASRLRHPDIPYQEQSGIAAKESP